MSVFKQAGADMTSALTINYFEEGMGIVKSAMRNELPVVISFTVETDGRLPSGESLASVIKRIESESTSYPLYYMINCAHPTHFIKEITGDFKWQERIKGIQANASCKSHAELNESADLDIGDKDELSEWYKTLKEHLPDLRVYGGCCGTDLSHMEAICEKII